MRMNLVVNDAPFGENPLHAHLDTTSGEIVLEAGHLDPADLKVSIDYVTAKAILVEGNPQAGMQAFMAGRIKVEGDMSKLLALQATPTDPVHVEMAVRMRDITE
jgi:putative sterol carrier protein